MIANLIFFQRTLLFIFPLYALKYILSKENESLGIIKEIKNEADTQIAVCAFDEDDAFYIDALEIPRKDIEDLANLNARRRQEILTSRYLLQHLTGENIWSLFQKDEYGKPYLAGTDLFISLSHSHNRSAAILSKKRVGIDLQKSVEKIHRIKNKFLNPVELLSLKSGEEISKLHLYWGAKESMYKAYGKKGVDFKEHLFVDYIDSIGAKGTFSSKMLKHDFKASYTMHYEKLDDFFLVYGIPVST